MSNLFPLQINIIDKDCAKQYIEDIELCRACKTKSPLVITIEDNIISVVTVADMKMKPVFVDFVNGKLDHRRKFVNGKEFVVKACFGKKKNPVIFDATAGLARDAFILACNGAQVHMFERNPIVRLLLKNGIERAVNSETDISELIRNNLILEDKHTIYEYDGELNPDVVYIDPMYPEKVKSALVKKDMQVFHELVGQDDDVMQLFQRAKEITNLKVVMKNPKWAPPLDVVSSNVLSKGHRFDIYVN